MNYDGLCRLILRPIFTQYYPSLANWLNSCEKEENNYSPIPLGTWSTWFKFIMTWYSQDVSWVIGKCYWFEKFTWWRLIWKNPCLPDVIQKKSKIDINEEDVDYLKGDISVINLNCDHRIQDISDGAVLLERKSKSYFLMRPYTTRGKCFQLK